MIWYGTMHAHDQLHHVGYVIRARQGFLTLVTTKLRGNAIHSVGSLNADEATW